MNKARQKIYDLCISRNFSTENYKNRLKEEFREIENQGEWEYFLDLYNQKVKYPNENNLLIPYLLGIVDEFDINKPPVTFVGDYPDIDVDFIKPVRDYIKNEWTPKTFGREFVCSIGNYTTFGIKNWYKLYLIIKTEKFYKWYCAPGNLGNKRDKQKITNFFSFSTL